MHDWPLGRWRRPHAVSDTIGAATGVTAMLITVAGLIAVGQAWSTQSILQRVANQAVQSEARQGCWTADTTDAVAESLQASTIAPGVVQVTHWTQIGTAYGNPVSVTLAAHFSVALYGATTVTASASAPSAYAAANGTPACAGATTPDLANPPVSTNLVPPFIQTVTPNPVTPGDSVTLTGTNLGAPDTSGDWVTFTDNGYQWGSGSGSGSDNTLVTTPSAWTATSLTFQVPASAPSTSGRQYATISVTTTTTTTSASGTTSTTTLTSAPMEVTVQ